MLVKTSLGPCIYVNYENYIEREIANNNFEREYLNLFYSTVNKGDIVVDVGTNIGFFALLASKKVGKEGRVYAFEPIERNYKRLLRNLEANYAENVKAFNFGLSDKYETLPMIVPEDNPGESSLSEKNWSELWWGFKTKKKIVNATLQTFDEIYMAENMGSVKIVKIDVEGAELKILKGMKNFLKVNKVNDY